MLLTLLALAAQPAAAEQPATPAAPDPRPYVALVTDLGTITVRIEDRRAPVTAKNFLRYVDTKRMDGFKFYRSTRTWGPASRLIQAGNRGNAALNFPAIEIGRAHVLTPVTNAHLVCRLLLAQK